MSQHPPSQSLASSQLASISNEHWRLQILPQLGGSILSLSSASGQPVLRPVELTEVQSSSQTSCFVLMPFSNRIGGNRFSFADQTVHLAPEARHGIVRNRTWSCHQVSEQHLRLGFSYDGSDTSAWPFAFSAQLEYILHGPHCDISLSLTSQSPNMPAGIGLHPYFASAESHPPKVQFGAELYYPTSSDLLPTSEARAVDEVQDYRQPRLVAAQTDRVYTAWDGIAQLIWPERSLTITADNSYSHLVLFAAPDGSVALEPVSHATDAFNLAARGVSGVDMRLLTEGQTLAGTVRLSQEGVW